MKPHGCAIQSPKGEMIIESFERTKSKAIDKFLRWKLGAWTFFGNKRDKNWEALRRQGFSCEKAFIPRIVKFENVTRILGEEEF